MPSSTKLAPRKALNVLVPVDGSSCSLRALARAIENATLTRCVVHLVNIQPAYDEYGMVPAYLSRAKFREVTRARADAALAPRLARLKHAGVQHAAHRADGDIASSIIRVARRLRCGSIVMGTRGMSAIRGLLLGSVANEVIHLARIPVTLVK